MTLNLTTRRGKGSALEHDEMDDNLDAIKSAVESLDANTTAFADSTELEEVSVDASAALVAMSDSGKPIKLPSGVYEVASDITLTTRVHFDIGAKIKPASGVTVTFAGGIAAHKDQHIFDASAGGMFSLGDQVYPGSFGATGSDAAVDTPALQAYVNHSSADWISSWGIDSGKRCIIDRDYTINATVTVPYDLIIEGYASLRAHSTFTGDLMLRVTNGRIVQNGQLQFVGNGTTVRSAIRCYNIARSKFQSICFDNFTGWALEVEPTGNNNTVEVTIQSAIRCGTTDDVAFTKASDTGSVGITQRSNLTVAVPQDTNIVEINDTVHLVTGWTASEIEVFPFAPASGTLTYVSGGVLSLGPHNDTNNWDIVLHALACPGTALSMRTLYGHTVRQFSSEANGIGIIFGQGIASPTIHGVVTAPYFEASRVRKTLNLADNSYVTFVEPMDADSSAYESLLYATRGYTILRQGGALKRTVPFVDRSIDTILPNDEPRLFFENSGAISSSKIILHPPDLGGAGKLELYLRGYSSDNFVVAAPAGHTVEGVAEYTLTNPPDGKVEIVLVGTDYKVF